MKIPRRRRYRPPDLSGPVATATWWREVCPKCSSPVWFLEDQKENTCGVCQTQIVRLGDPA